MTIAKIVGSRLTGLVALLVLVSAAGVFSAPRERILDFDSWIDISTDGTLRVIETIRVAAAGEAIKRGIYREFPTRYTSRDGRTVRMDFRVLSAERDGRPEPFHLKDTAGGKRVYMGKSDIRLPSGEHTYTLTYATDRQLGFFKDFDELYWNVTGNDWDFPIERVRAVVAIPDGADIVQTAAYTGRRGQQGRDFTVRLNELGQPVFATTRTLLSGEGLTVAVAWPKGFVTPPTRGQRIGYLVRDSAGVFSALVAIAILCGYYLLVWLRVGKDPDKGVVIARFYPPKGFSPAAVRYIMKMGYDHKSFAAALVDMAVKGAISIHQADDDGYSLQKAGGAIAALSRGEKRIYQALLGSRDSIRIERRQHRTLRKALDALKSSLSAEFDTVMFRRNAGYLFPGLAITLVGIAAVILTARDVGPAAFMGVWLTIWSLGCGVLAARLVAVWRSAVGRGHLRGGPLAGALFLTLFAVPFFAGWVFGFGMFLRLVSPLTALLTLALILVNLLFFHLLKAPTVDGQRVMEEIQGFARYLALAEKDRLNLLNPPDKTPQLFQAYLPYAMALDLEQEWGEQFAEVLSAMQADPSNHLTWYHGSSGHPTQWANLGSDLGGSLAGAVSSASTAPGSSSGSGGGGSSGGGGGGGGGGGW